MIRITIQVYIYYWYNIVSIFTSKSCAADIWQWDWNIVNSIISWANQDHTDVPSPPIPAAIEGLLVNVLLCSGTMLLVRLPTRISFPLLLRSAAWRAARERRVDAVLWCDAVYECSTWRKVLESLTHWKVVQSACKWVLVSLNTQGYVLVCALFVQDLDLLHIAAQSVWPPMFCISGLLGRTEGGVGWKSDRPWYY